ncbi:hypothetical protein BpHYR1_048778 [Brachionus plicatilis]|uniref:Uncharacterized protein n=1 Tax=Brachionus plicatilis TaxID=10195 RepID=A0A3M7SFH2_BRAPC|nr:hypothetical protein BpHYR1_048778 [Brachionus plicatilis]
MKLKIYFLFTFCVINCLVSKILNQSTSSEIIPLSPCKAQLNDGRLIDLTSLDNPTSPRVAEKAGFKYKFNPCSPIPCEGGQRASAAVN